MCATGAVTIDHQPRRHAEPARNNAGDSVPGTPRRFLAAAAITACARATSSRIQSAPTVLGSWILCAEIATRRPVGDRDRP